MAQFDIKLPDAVLRPDDIKSVRAFSERTDWDGLPSSAHTHASVIDVVMDPAGSDTSLAEELLLLLASYRMLLYADSLEGETGVDSALWHSWIKRIKQLEVTSQSDDADASQLCKDKLEICVEMMSAANDLARAHRKASRVLYASAREVSESANLQLADSADQLMKSALAIADLASQHAFDDAEQTVEKRAEPSTGKSTTIALAPLFWVAVFGSLVGLVWGLAVDGNMSVAASVGAASGVVVGLLLNVIARAAKLGGNLTDRECMFVVSNIAAAILMLAGALGLIVWIVRAVFF
jgi:hypothetical protein